MKNQKIFNTEKTISIVSRGTISESGSAKPYKKSSKPPKPIGKGSMGEYLKQYRY